MIHNLPHFPIALELRGVEEHLELMLVAQDQLLEEELVLVLHVLGYSGEVALKHVADL